MKTTEEMLSEMRQALAHHEREAATLRTMISAAEGKTPPPAPQFVPIVIPQQPIVPWTPPDLPPWFDPNFRFGEVICSAPPLAFG